MVVANDLDRPYTRLRQNLLTSGCHRRELPAASRWRLISNPPATPIFDVTADRGGSSKRRHLCGPLSESRLSSIGLPSDLLMRDEHFFTFIHLFYQVAPAVKAVPMALPSRSL